MQYFKALTLLSLLVLAAGNVSGQGFEIKEDSCGGNEQSLFSMYDKSGGNVAKPGYYKWEVCGAGIEEVDFAKTCPDNLDSIMSLNKENDSHASVYGSYRWQVCTSFPASINNSCATESRIVSLEKKDDSHVAEKGELQYQLCAEDREVETVTLEMEADGSQVYVDGKQAQEKEYNSSKLTYPYIVTDQPAGIVSYGSFLSLNYTTDGSTDIFRVKQDEGSFLIPHTEGGYQEIEGRQESVNDRDFLELASPSFGFSIPDNPTIKVIYDPGFHLIGFARELRNNIEIFARNRVDSNAQPDILLEPN